MKNKEIGVLLNIIGIILIIEGFFILLTTGFAIYYKEDSIRSFLISGLITLATGFILRRIFKQNKTLGNRRFAYLIVTIIWIVISLFGCLPYLVQGTFPNFTDAFFETVSGFTTTGASVLANPEGTPKSILFWRSLSHWMGGMGIIMMVIAVIPMVGINSFSLYSAEVSGPSKDKMHPKMIQSARMLWNTYSLFTFLIIVAFMIAGMNFFDAINHAFSAISTGGFSTKNDSLASYSPAIQYTAGFAMILSSVNFALIYLVFRGKFKKAFAGEEFRFHAKLFLIAVGIATLILISRASYGIEESFRYAFVQVSSIFSTTGLVAADYPTWGSALTLLLLLLMLIGGMAGSTSGGLKTIRLIILLKNTKLTLKSIVHSHAISPLKIDQKPISEKVLYNIMAFSLIYMITCAIGVLLLLIFDTTPLESIGATAACISGCGAGLGATGGFGSYLVLTTPAKWVCMGLMIVGRLELMTVYILFFRTFWKK